jgi:hypothetical protein
MQYGLETNHFLGLGEDEKKRKRLVKGEVLACSQKLVVAIHEACWIAMSVTIL